MIHFHRQRTATIAFLFVLAISNASSLSLISNILDPLRVAQKNIVHSRHHQACSIEPQHHYHRAFRPQSSQALYAAADNKDNDDDNSMVKKNNGISWLLTLVLPLWLVYISNQWSRSSIYYLVDFSPTAASFNAMNVDVGFSQAQYGLLASVAFTSLFAIASLGAGVASDRVNRKTLTIASTLTWSAATIGTALSQSYMQVVICRVIMGLACAFSTPAAYPLIRERVDPERAALASSLYGTGLAVASALASLSILLDTQLGWRNAYNVVAAYGLVAAVLTALLLKDDPKEPSSSLDRSNDKSDALVSSNFMNEVWPDVKEVVSTKRVQWILVGSLFRFASGLTIGVWSGTFFRMAFASHEAEYAVAQAAISAIGASCSGVIGGLIADSLVAKASKTPGVEDAIGRRLWVAVAGSILAAPTWYFAVQNGNSFETAMIWLGLEYLVAECWFGPTISTLQSTVGPKTGGTAQGIFALTGALANFAPSILGIVYSQTLQGTDELGAMLSDFLGIAVSSSYIISAVCFALAAQSATPTAPHDAMKKA